MENFIKRFFESFGSGKKRSLSGLTSDEGSLYNETGKLRFSRRSKNTASLKNGKLIIPVNDIENILKEKVNDKISYLTVHQQPHSKV